MAKKQVSKIFLFLFFSTIFSFCFGMHIKQYQRGYYSPPAKGLCFANDIFTFYLILKKKIPVEQLGQQLFLKKISFKIDNNIICVASNDTYQDREGNFYYRDLEAAYYKEICEIHYISN